MPRSPEPTRRLILDAALELFAASGIAAVSLRQIRLAAGQSNAGALHYHFGSKDGVLAALLERELPLLVQKRKILLAAALEEEGDVRSAAAVFVLPYAQLATGDEHERRVTQFLSQLHDDVSLSIEDIRQLIGDTVTAEAGALLLDRLDGSAIDPELLRERIRVGTNCYLHAAALWAKGNRREHQVSDAAFRSNLVDMFLGSVTAPASDPLTGL